MYIFIRNSAFYVEIVYHIFWTKFCGKQIMFSDIFHKNS